MEDSKLDRSVKPLARMVSPFVNFVHGEEPPFRMCPERSLHKKGEGELDSCPRSKYPSGQSGI